MDQELKEKLEFLEGKNIKLMKYGVLQYEGKLEIPDKPTRAWAYILRSKEDSYCINPDWIVKASKQKKKIYIG